jgi:hypothetical protein
MARAIKDEVKAATAASSAGTAVNVRIWDIACRSFRTSAGADVAAHEQRFFVPMRECSRSPRRSNPSHDVPDGSHDNYGCVSGNSAVRMARRFSPATPMG